ncbi:PQQ-binding-like beta-propeller repeat protein [Corynebacterium renale]|uniref:Rv3212 family protein n=1 Tax=Corynebacterium renale TaxID=1724 RepID=UPI00069F77FE|nr:hypothetical protein [Corynebacterium renale]
MSTKAEVLESPAQRHRNVRLAVALGVCAVLVLAVAYFTAPIRSSSLQAHGTPSHAGETFAVTPESLTEVWRAPAPELEGVFKPVAIGSVAVAYEDSTLRAFDTTGNVAWEYSRTEPLCALGAAWGRVVAVYRTGVGCGDAVAINAADGTYAATRSALNAADVATVVSNDRVGTVAPERLELWRSDLVRTIEYGEVEAPQEPDMQPNAQCTITSALTRSDNLAVTGHCPDGQSWLRFMDTTPEDSRKPEITQEINVPEGSTLVAISGDAAAIWSPTETGGELLTYGDDGAPKTIPYRAPMPVSAGLTAWTGDVQHNMTWFDGSRLCFFHPTYLGVSAVSEEAIGNPINLGSDVVVPVRGGLAVMNPDTGEVVRTIPVDRGEYSGPVGLATTGRMVVEKRGNELVALG